MEGSKPKLYARLRVKTGEYESDGKTKNRYAEIGVLFASPHFSNMYMNIDTLPISKDWDGRVFVNPIEQADTDESPTHKFNKEITKDILPTDEDIDKPVDFSEIPF
jgi:hypothetical protein